MMDIGRCQSKRAGASNDEHRDRIDEGVGQTRLRPPLPPDNQGNNGNDDDGRYKPGGNHILPVSGSAPGLRCASLTILLPFGPIAFRRRPSLGKHQQHYRCPLTVAPIRRSPVFFSAGTPSPGHHGFINTAITLLHDTVNRDFFDQAGHVTHHPLVPVQGEYLLPCRRLSPGAHVFGANSSSILIA